LLAALRQLFLDYFATGALDVDHAAAVVGGIAEGCKRANAALIGGETAEMPGMYAKGDFDLAGFAVGAMERGTALPRPAQPGDVLIGLGSDGVHSNGYSLVRKTVETAGLGWDDPAPFADAPLGAALLAPTRIYVKSCLGLRDLPGLRGLAHITGGGLTENVPRILPEGLGLGIDLDAWRLPPVFADTHQVQQTIYLATANPEPKEEYDMFKILTSSAPDEVVDLNAAGSCKLESYDDTPTFDA